jgi:hypothetical protein
MPRLSESRSDILSEPPAQVAEERAPRYTYTYTAAQQQQQQQTEVEDVEDVEEGELLDEETLPAFPGLFADRSAPAHGSLNAGPTARVPLPPLPNVSHLLSAALPTYAAVESGDGDDDECEERAPMTKHAWAPHAGESVRPPRIPRALADRALFESRAASSH